MMEWSEDEKYQTSENHPLRKLKPCIEVDLRNISRDLPINKINEFAKQVEELKKNLLK